MKDFSLNWLNPNINMLPPHLIAKAEEGITQV